MRFSIDLTESQYEVLKAVAEASGDTLKCGSIHV